MTYRRLFSLRQAVPQNAVPQSEPLPGQSLNNAGGHWYEVGDWGQLDRFLLLGSEGGTYYVGERALTRDNAMAVQRCLIEDGQRVVARTVEISQAGRAPRNDPALFVLAMAAAAEDEATRRAALSAIPLVARTGTHILAFADMIEGFRGWGRGLRRGVARWFTAQDPNRLALQAVKYMNRGGWALRDLLRLAHPLTDEAATRVLFDWIAHPNQADAVGAARAAFPLVDGLYRIREASGPTEAAAIIRNRRLPREAVPTELLTAPEVWESLLADMPLGALIRNLGKLSQVGLLNVGSEAAATIVRRLADGEALSRARIHPVQVLLALKTYAQGHGERGKLNWTPVPAVVDALDGAFDRAFAAIEPTGKRLLVGVDVSGSMHGTRCAGSPTLSAIEAAASMAMAFVRTERQVEVVAFDTELHSAPLTPRQRLDDVVRLFGQWQGGTDIALPISYALERKLEVDAIVVITDNETWAGRQHPIQALKRYRETVNPAAKAVVLAATANAGSVVPDDDPLSLGCAGFDAAVPQVVTGFLKG
ncbi:TROVE domain-containing protein [Magnetospirillum sp. UT-4]|uniref:TROVE domain-containing protein n=1 Tax=Magnetospirillum sp. UT-4 TaxID=2681467 RepID=UPI00137DB44F|nr:TROVE domain-containing protein [Magnetospirillum sp. UT-4]CAA7615678.1 60 kDa SS-A/Ro ribonucleoprotein homolog [Magnetospirillum sp. UT-4]